MNPDVYSQKRADLIAFACISFALFAVIYLKLLGALLAGLLVHELVHMMAAQFFRNKAWGRAKVLALVILLTTIVMMLAGAVIAIVVYFGSDTESPAVLLQKLADTIAEMRKSMPEGVQKWIPEQITDMKEQLSVWLKSHAEQVRNAGGAIAHLVVTSIVGMVIGALVSLKEAISEDEPRYLTGAVTRCLTTLTESFRRIVFAQLRISALNTVLTSAYLLVVLPLMGIHLPLTETMILVTFLAGLIPIVGNLISNAVIVIISLRYSWEVAVGSLAFLVVIHKLEYFFNAKIVGTQIKSSAFELLSAMLIMEAAFGIPGIVAAPIYYAYFKNEFNKRGWL